MTLAQDHQPQTGWNPYSLDHDAQELVIQNRDQDNVLNESHKMRMSVAYGLERFWGEHLRLLSDRNSQEKGRYWKSVWDKLEAILKTADIELPNDSVKSNLPDKTKEEKKRKQEDESKKIKAMAARIWKMPIEDQRVALMVLTQFCDALVWWTQRYKIRNGNSSQEP
ncbi:MAG: hypothetical protein HC936_15885 [Leptolyngbyaceae cyanobacterium SU_3_3]|nr:hypothetical protein [Leptolyngbyaceae cyanobacterium SU_3_3]